MHQYARFPSLRCIQVSFSRFEYALMVAVYKYLWRPSSQLRFTNILGCIHVGCGVQIFVEAIISEAGYKYLWVHSCWLWFTNIWGGNLLGGRFQIFVGAFIFIHSYWLRFTNIWGCSHVGCSLKIVEGALMMVAVFDVLMCVWGGLGQGPWGQLYNIGLT